GGAGGGGASGGARRDCRIFGAVRMAGRRKPRGGGGRRQGAPANPADTWRPRRPHSGAGAVFIGPIPLGTRHSNRMAPVRRARPWHRPGRPAPRRRIPGEAVRGEGILKTGRVGQVPPPYPPRMRRGGGDGRTWFWRELHNPVTYPYKVEGQVLRRCGYGVARPGLFGRGVEERRSERSCRT